MNREIKLKFVFKHPDGEIVITPAYTLDEILQTSLDDIKDAWINCNCVPIGEVNYVECNCDERFGQFELVAKLQFTGLHDKNGTAIYEGDVCKVGNACSGKIIWHEKHCQFKIVWIDKRWLTIRGNNWERYQDGEAIFGNHELTFEVIGDIFSNPELLTK